MKNEAAIDGIVVAGQPSDEELQGLSQRGIRNVVNVRMPDEPGGADPAKLAAGTAYAQVGFTGDTLSVEHVVAVRKALDAGSGPALIH